MGLAKPKSPRSNFFLLSADYAGKRGGTLVGVHLTGSRRPNWVARPAVMQMARLQVSPSQILGARQPLNQVARKLPAQEWFILELHFAREAGIN